METRVIDTRLQLGRTFEIILMDALITARMDAARRLLLFVKDAGPAAEHWRDMAHMKARDLVDYGIVMETLVRGGSPQCDIHDGVLRSVARDLEALHEHSGHGQHASRVGLALELVEAELRGRAVIEGEA